MPHAEDRIERSARKTVLNETEALIIQTAKLKIIIVLDPCMQKIIFNYDYLLFVKALARTQTHTFVTVMYAVSVRRRDVCAHHCDV